MGLFSRIAQFLRIRTSAALDKAEKPGEVLDYAYQQQLEQLPKIRQSIVEVKTNEKLLEAQMAEIVQKIDKLDRQALQALQMGRDDLARLALQKKEVLLPQIAAYERQIAQLKEQAEKLIATERVLTARVEAFRTQKEMVKAQYNAAQAQVKVNETITGISEEMSEMNLAMQRAQDKILTMQARASALDALIDEGTLSDQGLLPAEDALDRELRQLSAQQNVEAQLQVLKQQLQLGGPDAQQRQIEGPDVS